MSESAEQEIARLREIMGSDRDPDGRAFAPLADALRRTGRHEEARDVVSQGLERHPDFVTGHLVAGRVYRDHGDPEEAERAFRKVIELDPENVFALHGLGRMLVVRGEIQEASALLTRAAGLGYGTDLQERKVTLEEVVPEEVAPAEVAPEEGVHADDEVEAPVGDAADTSPVTAAGVEDLLAPKPSEEELDLDEGPRTRTMAELYVRQGMRDRAMRVYEHLLRNDPGNPELEARLDELKRRPSPEAVEEASDSASGDGASEVIEEAEDSAFDPFDVVEEATEADEPVPTMDFDALAPDEEPEPAEMPVLDMDALAPDEEDEPAHEPVPTMELDALAPDEPEPADAPVFAMSSLAPDPVAIEDLAPDGSVLDIGVLAPDDSPDGER